MNRSDGLFAAGVAALVLLAFGLLPTPEARAPVDSFSESSAGKKAFFLLVRSLLGDVERSSGTLVPGDAGADTLVLLGPARYPTRAQWQTLHDWVSEGRALVFAARYDDPAVLLEPFGLRVVPRSGSPANPQGIETGLVDAPMEWPSFAEIRAVPPAGPESSMNVALRLGGMPQVVWKSVGDGIVVVVASDRIFTNRSLAEGNNGLLAFRILELAAPSGPVYFDEAMNASGTPKVVGILFEPPFRLLTAQLLLVTLLFGWMASRRFGPARSPSSAPRRSLVEHAEALGGLHFRVGTGAPLIAAYLEYFRHDLGLRVSAGRGIELRGADDEIVAEAVRASKNPHLDREGVAHLFQRLSRYRRQRTTGTTSGRS